MTRERLPNRRPSELVDIGFGPRRLTIALSRFEDGRPAEVFADIDAKSGTELASIVRDAAVLTSIALQHGAPLAALAGAVTREEDGESPASVIGALLDAVARAAP
jgi:hypothetical protein